MTVIQRVIKRQTPALLRGIQARSQGTAAIARHANEHMTANESHPKSFLKPNNFNSSGVPKNPVADFSSVALKRDDGDYYFETHSEALSSALNSYLDLPEQEEVRAPVAKCISATARDMDLVEASHAARDYESYDKILILMRHGEAKHNVFERDYVEKTGTSNEEANSDQDYPVDPMLTGRGCGQMLDVSRRTATFFNKETGLQPDLVVVSPLRRAIQSALISFPTHAALTSLSNTPWICHPGCMEQANGNKSEFVSSSEDLEQMFPGVDFSLFEESLVNSDVNELNGRERVPLLESKIDLMGRTNDFLAWVKERDERVIVVSSHATWLQSLCAFSLNYESEDKGLEMFKKGEMRAVGLKFV